MAKRTSESANLNDDYYCVHVSQQLLPHLINSEIIWMDNWPSQQQIFNPNMKGKTKKKHFSFTYNMYSYIWHRCNLFPYLFRIPSEASLKTILKTGSFPIQCKYHSMFSCLYIVQMKIANFHYYYCIYQPKVFDSRAPIQIN